MAQPVVDRCPHLIDVYQLEDRFMISPLVGDNIKRTVFGGAGFLPVPTRLINNEYYRKTRSCRRMRS